MYKKFDRRGALILGINDAIVSLTGLIAGLLFALTDKTVIVISCVIASLSASLSMGAANYQATKSGNKKHALSAGFYTGLAYMATCGLLVIPFFIFDDQFIILASVLGIVLLIIFVFNRYFYCGKEFWKHFLEMLSLCTIVSVISFIIGEIANKLFGI